MIFLKKYIKNTIYFFQRKKHFPAFGKMLFCKVPRNKKRHSCRIHKTNFKNMAIRLEIFKTYPNGPQVTTKDRDTNKCDLTA